MSSSITLDRAGRFVLPKSVRDRLHLREGTRMKLEVIADKIELTAEPDTKVRLVEKDGMLVLRGVAKNFDAVKTLKAARDERDVQLARSLRTR